MSNTFNELLEAGAHFGHLKRKWNPAMAPYIYAEKNGIHIIDLNKTVAKIDEAAAALKQIARSGKKVLFVATKKQAKDIRSAYKDALAGSGEYVEIIEKIKTLRERKKQIENTIKNDFSGEFTKLEDFKVDLESDNTMLADAAITKMMKGEKVEVVDEYNNTYEPEFKVKFKKS